MKVGKPVARTTRAERQGFVASECPLAGEHIVQGVDALGGDKPRPQVVKHPIQIFARSYGIES